VLPQESAVLKLQRSLLPLDVGTQTMLIISIALPDFVSVGSIPFGKR
jgi:hypothetical protein